MKRIYLVKLEDFAEPFMAFERESDAYEYAKAYCESMPCGGERVWRTMVRECFYIEDGRITSMVLRAAAEAAMGDGPDMDELDRILREEAADE